MSAYEPGTVALDLSEFREAERISERTRIDHVAWLRNLADRDERNEPVFCGPQRRLVRWIADAIEAQTRPAITEPGWGHKVTATVNGKGPRREFVNAYRALDVGTVWTDEYGTHAAWSDLTDVTVLSEGWSE